MNAHSLTHLSLSRKTAQIRRKNEARLRLTGQNMGIVDCPRHGGTGFYEVCTHVGDAFRKRNYEPFHRLNFYQNVIVCDSCWEQNDLVRFESHPDIAGKRFYEADEDKPMVKEYRGIYESINTHSRCWCVKCVAEIEANACTDIGAAGPE